LNDRTYSIEAQTRFWNDWNSANREHASSLPEVVARQADTVLGWMGDTATERPRILEVGCGVGWLSRRLAALGDVTAVDLSDEVISRARQRHPEVSFVAGDFLTLAIETESYDVVVSLEVLAHVVDQPAFVSKVARCLRPGGCFMMSTQNRFALSRWSEVVPQADGQLRNWVDAKTLRGLLQRYLEVVSLSSIVPVGDRGLLRWVNSHKLNRIAELCVSRERINAWKERLFLGHTLMALARKDGRQPR